MLDYKKFTLDYKDEFERLCKEYPSPSCERSFATSFVWKVFFDYHISNWRDRLVIYEKSNGWLMYPLGAPTTPDMLEELLGQTEAAGHEVSAIYDIAPDYPDKFPELSNYFKISAEEKYFDYLYDLQKLSLLKGENLRKKRNLIKQFRKNNPNWRAENIDKSNLLAAKDFMQAKEFESEITPISCTFDNFFELNFYGVILFNELGEIAAVSVMSAINADCHDVNFEKSDKDCIGAPQMIVKLETDLMLSKGAKIMNREQDMGIENLRHAKRSLDPILYKRLMLLKK